MYSPKVNPLLLIQVLQRVLLVLCIVFLSLILGYSVFVSITKHALNIDDYILFLLVFGTVSAVFMACFWIFIFWIYTKKYKPALFPLQSNCILVAVLASIILAIKLLDYYM
jgi:hypothetical protein